MKRKRAHVVRDVAQLELLGSPARLQLVMAMSRLGPSTAADLAASLNRPAETLYYHLHKLVEGGLARTAGSRPGRRRPQAVYELVQPLIQVDPKATDPAYLETLGDLYAASLRHAGRTLRRALTAEADRPEGTERETGVLQVHVQLKRKDYAEVRRRLLELTEFALERHVASGEEREYCLTLAVSPVPPGMPADTD
ncbi:MAG: helix-turn-helix domain-containing protein [Planctomycetota bacterium]